MRPNFFIVGAWKAGTTSLYRYLATHPEVFMCPLKEPHYFVPHSLSRPQWVSREADYLALFEGAGDAKAVGEASAHYFTTQGSAARIDAFATDARIIIMLRHPAEMLYAHYYEQRFVGREGREFSEAWPDYALLYGQFPARLSEYLERFGKERIFVVMFDDLVRDASGTYGRVLAFLGLAAHTPKFTAHNPAKALPARWRARLSASAPVVAAVRFLHRFPKLAMAMDRARAGRVRYAPRPQMEPALRAALLAACAPATEALEAMLARDLSAWRQ